MGSKGKRRFKAPKGPGGNMMRQLEELQNQMAQAQSSLEEETVTVSVGGGAITVVMSGTQELKSIKIQPEVVDPEDVEMLQDLIVAAIKEAQNKSQELAASKLGPLAGGIDIPGLF
ncbi:MAG TPA: YbaB/EbfC family nucleoid-associated protein [Chloroflexi bacterium]|nr:YbaB/EbfC family nucleoid-associated protein [Chloroflexota bacterium]